jgi:hypothetical protein
VVCRASIVRENVKRQEDSEMGRRNSILKFAENISRRSITIGHVKVMSERDRLQLWCEERKIQLQFIQPGKPVKNAFIERNNGSLKSGLLNAYPFFTFQEIRQMAE